ncbi:BnaA07g09520D [Brassica napus]|uniref:BnaA07g09520D protein n=1 Tax=Brassica napus TaxID=3708 RepID=A0A078HU19_BRANA|nr:BnaA07g09520D [Brassica napus]
MLYSHLLHPYTLWLWHALRKLLSPWMRYTFSQEDF